MTIKVAKPQADDRDVVQIKYPGAYAEMYPKKGGHYYVVVKSPKESPDKAEWLLGCGTDEPDAWFFARHISVERG